MKLKEDSRDGRGAVVRRHGAFWRLLRLLPGYDEREREELKRTLVRQWSGGRTESLSELWERWPAEYSRMVDALKGGRRQRLAAYEKGRDRSAKRVIAAVCGYIDKCGYRFGSPAEKVAYAKSVACRSANCRDFNKIPMEKLDAIYAMFRKKGSVDVGWNAALNHAPGRN